MQNLLNRLQSLLPSLKKRYPIAEMAVFGSQVSGETHENSDVDILVAFNGPIGIEFIDLADEIEKYLGQKVDLVSRDALKPRQLEYINNQAIYVQ